MRIISGYLKGKKILQPSDKTTRPLKDITKEAIFNIITHSNKFSVELDNSKILDLFSGVGSFGVECLSRGAKYVTFVENYSKTLNILKQNIQNFELKDKCEIITDNIFDESFLHNSTTFDAIGFDVEYVMKYPPVGLEKVPQSLSNLSRQE